MPVLTYELADKNPTFNCVARTAAPATFKVPRDEIDVFALKLAALTVPEAYASVVVIWLLEFNDITNALLDVYNERVLTNEFADTEPTFSCPASTEEPATFKVPSDVIELLAVSVVEFTVLA